MIIPKGKTKMMLYEAIVAWLEKIEDFLGDWQQISAIFISLITSFLVPFLIYWHQRKETNEKVRQGIISVIEEVEIECHTIEKIVSLCKDVSIIGTYFATISYRDDDYLKSIEIAKRRFSEFKTLSRHLPSTDKIRKFETVLIQNQNKKVLIAKRGKKIRIKRLEELLSSIYDSLETNYYLRIEVIKKIPEVDPIADNIGTILEFNEGVLFMNICDTFAALMPSLSNLSNNSDFIIKTWNELRTEIY